MSTEVNATAPDGTHAEKKTAEQKTEMVRTGNRRLTGGKILTAWSGLFK
ncbi:MAG: hypothetical protein M0036_03160 [Desulfobacteraceae bacterium]|nr:hypothetical protein [Desulfobacteraceae bacterium]